MSRTKHTKFIQENRVQEKLKPNSIYYSEYEAFWALKTDLHLKTKQANANASLGINLKQQLNSNMAKKEKEREREM